MKKIKIFATAILFCGASLLGYNAYSNATMTPEERLFQQNLEALTNTEDYSSYCSTLCRSLDDYYCVLDTPQSFIYCFDRYPFETAE